ncbi:MAG: phospholipase [Vicinamibacterales bacterium]
MDPHAHQPVEVAGAPLGGGQGVVIMVHGRGASPQNILDLVPQIARPSFTYLAPSAAGRSWYPFGFMHPTEENEPKLSSALARIGSLVSEVLGHGVRADRIMLLGFSQGACLTGEYAYRHPMRYGGVAMLSGGLIGPPGTEWDATGSFRGTPVFLGCSDCDAHIPKTRVDESAQVFERLGASVTERIYPGMGHLVSSDEVVEVRAILDQIQ